MNQKRGVSQIDWVISLAFFLIFVMFFFMFLGTRTGAPIKSTSLLTEAETSFFENNMIEVKRTPLFLDIKKPGPAIAEFSLNETANYFFESKCYSIDEDKFFYIVTDETPLHLVTTDKTYPPCTELPELVHYPDSASTAKAGFNFEQGLLKSATYKTNNRILNMNYVGNFTGDDYYGDKIIAKYVSSSDDLEHTSYIIANGTGELAFVKPYYSASHTEKFSIKATIFNYENWYIYNGVEHRSPSPDGCGNFQNVEFIDFYNNNEGIAFVLENANVKFCSNSNIELEIEFSDFNELSYNFYFHDGNYQTAQNTALYSDAWLGMTKTLTGLYEENLDALSSKNYSELRREYGFPLTKELAYEIYQEDVLIYEYDKSTKLGSSNVFVNGKKTNIINKFGNQTSVEVFTRIW